MAKRTFTITLDLVLLACLGAVAFVAVGGGGVLSTDSFRISVRSTGNPIAFALTAGMVRYLVDSRAPFLLIARLRIDRLERNALALVTRLSAGLPPRHETRLLVSAIAVSLGLRLLNVWLHPGFYSGDDVEVQEMTLRHIFRTEWPIWNLRNATFPMVFVYPAQVLAGSVGIVEPGTLVVVGRLNVLLWATLSVWLIYRIARRLSSQRTTAVLAVVFFSVSRLHLWFGASELPRPVSSVFILAAFLLLLPRDRWATVAAGTSLAVGGVLRFAELVFLVPAVVMLAGEGRKRDLVVLTVVATSTAVVVLGVSDWLYWGQPFYSLQNAIQYTLIERQSSRGFQPFWYYVWSSSEWTTVVTLALSLLAFRTNEKTAALWAWLPILVLSLLPHKEPRYMVAVLPLLCVAAAGGVTSCARWIGGLRQPIRERAALALVVLLGASTVFELSSWHFRKSDEEVAIATRLAETRPSGIAAEQLWRFGGRIYWRRVPVLIELTEVSAPSLSAVDANQAVDWLLLRTSRQSDELGTVLASDGRWHRWEGAPASDYLVFTRRQRSPSQSGGADRLR